MINIDCTQKYILENDRVALYPLENNAIEKLSYFSMNEPELWKYSLIKADSEDNLKKYIHLALQARENQTGYPFIIYDKLTQSYAGSTRLYDINPINKSLLIGYTWIGKDYQGTGLNINCKFLLLEFSFEVWGMERVEFRADFENKKSIAAMKKIGCVEEGILRSNGVKPDGSRRDSIILSILRSEWTEIKHRFTTQLL